MKKNKDPAKINENERNGKTNKHTRAAKEELSIEPQEAKMSLKSA